MRSSAARLLKAAGVRRSSTVSKAVSASALQREWDRVACSGGRRHVIVCRSLTRVPLHPWCAALAACNLSINAYMPEQQAACMA